MKDVYEKITEDVFLMWETGFRAGYDSCIEDMNELKKKIKENEGDIQ